MTAVTQLAQQIAHHNKRYWDDNDPEIPDEAYDDLVRQLTKLDPSNPVLTQLGPSPDSAGTKVAHAHPMLSLEKAYTDDEIKRWAKGKTGTFAVSPKLDGVAASLHYDDGKLRLAVTRGDGVHGEDFTANAYLIPDVPNTVPIRKPFEVRGEIVMDREVFAKRFADDYANTRNLTAGSIKAQNDQDRRRCEHLSFRAYGLYGTPSKSVQMDVKALSKLGFQSVPYRFVHAAGIMPAVVGVEGERDRADFDTDGAVIRMDDHAAGRSLGNTSHHPKHSIAYKWQTQAEETTVTGAEWSVSRLAIITPVVLMEGVELDGAVVGRATAHNLTQFAGLGLRVGDTIQVKRAGGVIPYIVGNVSQLAADRGIPIEPPATCPSCGSPTKVLRGNTADVLVCTTPQACRGVVEQRIEHFTKRMKMDGFGPSVCSGLYDLGVRLFANLYHLTSDHLTKMPKTGSRKAAKLLKEIEASKTAPLARVLQALSIDGLGRKLSGQLEAVYKDVDDPLLVIFQDAKSGKLARTIAAQDGQGTAIADLVPQGIHEAGFEIHALRPVLSAEAAIKVVGPLSDQSFVFTGEFSSGVKRSVLQQAVEDLGGECPSGVKKSLTYLVVGGAGSKKYADGKKGTKERKAEKYNQAGSSIRIIGEAAFFDLMEAHGWDPDVGRPMVDQIVDDDEPMDVTDVF
jgi:DNA ligase (NAD+)